MKGKLDSKTNYYIESLRLNPKKEDAVRKLIESVSSNGGTNNTDKDVSILMLTENDIEDFSEVFIDALKSSYDLTSYDNPTLISTDIAHNILDLNAIISGPDGLIKADKTQQTKYKSPLQYNCKGNYINVEGFEGFESMEDKGYNVYTIIANNDYILQITHVINENAFDELGEGFNKLGFYIQNYIPT